MPVETTTDTSGRLAPVLGVARAPFLALPLTLAAVGVGAASLDGVVDVGRAVLATVGLIAAHVAVNALNEARDYESGIDLETESTPFSGGSGTLPSGALSPRDARYVGYAGLAVAAAVGIWFLTLVGPALLPIVALGGLTVVAYTPVFTKYGLGELAAGLGLGFLPVVGIGFVQTGQFTPALLLAAVPPLFLTFDLLLLNEFPDLEPDRAGGRRNLLHRFGRRAGGLLYVLAGVAAVATVVGGVVAGLLPVPALLALVPFALFGRCARWALTRPDTDVPVARLRDNVLWILATNLALAVGLLV
ncbi:prenyltransferase [Halorientalis pallida]|uniref:Prenyltransferase n=1 Tax=Halorientalis pallida TaxID=2479928 RepID=A0A498L136_9EURY|nr:prenyltransferase [Halorientalis pallida]RXK49051.1 prenyltransferase [Halorientalis pallida]